MKAWRRVRASLYFWGVVLLYLSNLRSDWEERECVSVRAPKAEHGDAPVSGILNRSERRRERKGGGEGVIIQECAAVRGAA